MTRGLFLIFLTIVSSAACWAQSGGSSNRPNPHRDGQKCQVCHEAKEEDLRSWFTFPSTKRKLTKDPNAVCTQCHEIGYGHGVGKIPPKGKTSLPLGHAGTIACAITCHDMHVQTDDREQTRFHLRLPVEPLCLSCHNN